MRFSSKSQIFAVAFSIALVVLLFLLPNEVETKHTENKATASSLEEAVEFVKSGKDPMKGILKLREIAEKNPKNVEAQFYLGIFSVQSGQYNKAVKRFEKVLEIDNTFSEAYLYLGHSYSNLGEKELAIENFEKFKASTDDVKLKEEADKHIKNLKNK